MDGLRFSRNAALILGVLLPAVETWRRWPVLDQWQFWLEDLIGGILLVWGWHAGRSAVSKSRPYLMAAWGYVMGIAYLSFVGQISDAEVIDISGLPGDFVVCVKGCGLALAAACLFLTWTAGDTPEVSR